jgi:hypothetical protein
MCDKGRRGNSQRIGGTPGPDGAGCRRDGVQAATACESGMKRFPEPAAARPTDAFQVSSRTGTLAGSSHASDAVSGGRGEFPGAHDPPCPWHCVPGRYLDRGRGCTLPASSPGRALLTGQQRRPPRTSGAGRKWAPRVRCCHGECRPLPGYCCSCHGRMRLGHNRRISLPPSL